MAARRPKALEAVDSDADRSTTPGEAPSADEAREALRMTADRILVLQRQEGGERRSRAGILIPATAAVGRRLVWAEVISVGPTVRNIEAGDRVLFSPEDAFEVDLQGDDYQIVRERDIHAVGQVRSEGRTGLYL